MKQVFVSYSWDSILHKSKVKARICDRLKSDGVDVVADCYLDKLDLGEDITKFMQNGIASANRVIVVLTPEYIKKLENGKGGVANEELIISNEIMDNVNTKKFIPVYMDNPSFEDMPLSMQRRNGVSFNTEADVAENYPKLLASIKGDTNQIEVDSKDSPDLNLNINMINRILEKYEIEVSSKPTVISRRRFKKGSKGKGRFLETVSSKLEKSKDSLLIGTKCHWLLYDVQDEMVKYPDKSKPITIEKFIKDYSDELFFHLHRIR